jgi:hypothetical protein
VLYVILCDVCYFIVLYFTVMYYPVLHCSTLPPGINPFEVLIIIIIIENVVMKMSLNII